MKYLQKFFLFIVMVCCIAACSNPHLQSSFDKAEALMETCPDSAMQVLKEIDTALVNSGKDRARYALLMSMALDKNFIDTTDFCVLQPAIDYYLKKGTPNEKLRTYYYQGRIQQNRGERDEALKTFMKGIANVAGITDSLYMARSFVAQGLLYRDFYNLDGYAESYRKAADLYHALQRGRPDLYRHQEFDCLINLLNAAVISGKQNQADSLMAILDNRFTGLSDSENDRLQGNKLAYILEFKDSDAIRVFIEDNGDEWVTDTNGLLNMADAYNRTGVSYRAMNLLEEIHDSGLAYDSLKYQLVLTEVLEGQGNYKDAFYSLWKLVNLRDSVDQVRLEKRIQYIKEINTKDIEFAREKARNEKLLWGSIGCGLVLGLIIVNLILQVRNNRTKKNLALERAKVAESENRRLESEKELALERAKVAESENQRLESEKELALERARVTELENAKLKDEAELAKEKAKSAQLEAENLSHRITALEQERDKMKSILEESPDFTPDVRHAIQEYIEMLNAHLAYYITDNANHDKPYDDWLATHTADIEKFMNSNRLAFKASYPKFIKYFEDHKLTDNEINYVCLYALNLNGKEVGRYMKRPGHINISSAIRRKLDLNKHQSNIGVYVRRLKDQLKD